MAQGVLRLTGVVAGNGTALLTIQPAAQTWTVQQISTEATGPKIGALSYLRQNGSILSRMLAAGDVAGQSPAVTIRPGDVITVDWTGMVAGSLVKLTAIYQDGI